MTDGRRDGQPIIVVGTRIAGYLLAVWIGFCLAPPVPAEEARASTPGGAVGAEGDPLAEAGTGMLFWNHPRGRRPLPMLDLHAELAVSGFMVHGTVLQAFDNPTGETIEAIYVFPLPEQAAVHHMEIRIGERRIVSVIQEKQEARRTYARAKQEGRKAALLEQQRPNLFTTAVTGINPGESVQVRLEYVEELTYSDGEFGLTFPLTHTRRYGPPVDDQPLPAGTSSTWHGSMTEVESGAGAEPDVPPEPGNALPPEATVVVRLDAGLPLEDVVSVSHPLATWWDGDVLVIEAGDGAPVATDRDFHLRFRPLVGHAPASALLTEKRGDGRYLLAMVLPPVDRHTPTGLATETLFIVDQSGSMAGPSMAQARQALLAALDRLHPEDRFNVLAFSDSVRAFASESVPAQESELAAARRWVGQLAASGGTRIDLALEAGLTLVSSREDWRVKRIIFLTDGAVSFEDGVLGSIQSRLGAVRLHTLGIGAAPNRYLMRKMATAGHGLCDFISSIAASENRIDAFLSRLARPVMTDITLIWEGEQPLEIYPQRLPDLHAGEPLYLSARFEKNTVPGRLRLEGRTHAGPVSTTLTIGDGSENPTGIATRWARAKVSSLMDTLHEGAPPGPVRDAVIGVSRRFGIVTRYTSLVAVEEIPSTSGTARTMRVRAATPAGALPMGGTAGPLVRLLALACGLAAAVAWWLARALQRQRLPVRP